MACQYPSLKIWLRESGTPLPAGPARSPAVAVAVCTFPESLHPMAAATTVLLEVGTPSPSASARRGKSSRVHIIWELCLIGVLIV